MQRDETSKSFWDSAVSTKNIFYPSKNGVDRVGPFSDIRAGLYSRMILALPQLLELSAIVVSGTMVGNELGIAVFVHPKISRLGDSDHLRTVQPLASVLGTVMPFWYALTLLASLAVAFYARPAGTPGHGLAIAASGLFAATIVYTLLWLAPINSQVARWQPENAPVNWRELRHRWDVLHVVRCIILSIALILLVSACL